MNLLNGIWRHHLLSNKVGQNSRLLENIHFKVSVICVRFMNKYLTLCYIFFFFLIRRRLSFLKTFLVSVNKDNVKIIFIHGIWLMFVLFVGLTPLARLNRLLHEVVQFSSKINDFFYLSLSYLKRSIIWWSWKFLYCSHMYQSENIIFLMYFLDSIINTCLDLTINIC